MSFLNLRRRAQRKALIRELAAAPARELAEEALADEVEQLVLDTHSKKFVPIVCSLFDVQDVLLAEGEVLRNGDSFYVKMTADRAGTFSYAVFVDRRGYKYKSHDIKLNTNNICNGMNIDMHVVFTYETA